MAMRINGPLNARQSANEFMIIITYLAMEKTIELNEIFPG